MQVLTYDTKMILECIPLLTSILPLSGNISDGSKNIWCEDIHTTINEVAYLKNYKRG